jgi:hypothetical protein
MKRGPARFARAAFVAFALVPALAAAETFVAFGTQPDGALVYVQSAPPAQLADGRRQAWFRTVARSSESVRDEFGVVQQYHELLALNVADCKARRMGAASMTYRDDHGVVVARFEIKPAEMQLVGVRANTLGESMLGWLCTPRIPAAAPPSAAGAGSPFK